MATSKQSRGVLAGVKENIGLLANGASGQWEVAIDETISGTDRWFAQIEGTAISFYFEIPSPDIVDKVIQFLEGHSAKRLSANSSARNGPLTLGKDKHAPVRLIRDDEFSDRYFLVVGPPAKPFVRFSISGPDLQSITEAFRQAREDLVNEA